MPDFNSPAFLEAAKNSANKTDNNSAASAIELEANKAAAETARLEAEKNNSATQKLEAEKQLAEINRIAAEKTALEESEKNKVVISDEQFEKYLETKSNGKYKKFDEIELAINTPKTEFANEKVKHLNDLAAKGIDVTSKEFLELQAIDFDKIEAADDLLYEKMKRSEEGSRLSEKAIRALINKKYNVDEWREKLEDELTDDDKLNQELMLRDKEDSKDWLKKYKEERTLAQVPDPKIAEAKIENDRLFFENWEKDAESSIKEITKLSTKLNEKESFDFEIPAEDRKKILDVVNLLAKDASVPFSKFINKDDKGNISVDKGGIALMLFKAENYDKAVALSASDATAKERLRIEKEYKGIDFKPNEKGTQTTPVYKTLQEAHAASIKNTKV